MAAISGFIADDPLAASGGPGGRRAALMVPRGCEDVVMLEVVETGGSSEYARTGGGGDRTVAGGLPSGEEMLSSGEVGGDGEWKADCSSSGDDMVR